MTSSPRVLTFGEALGLGSSAEYGRFEHAPNLRIGFGGSESNVAIGLRRLGIEVTWVSRLGRDSVGQLIIRELRAEGVDARVIIDGARPTGFMLKERLGPSRTTVTYYRTGSAATRLGPGDLPLDAIGTYGLLHLTGITPALGRVPQAAVREAMAAATAAGVPISFDLNYRSALWSKDEAAAEFRKIVPASSIVFAGLDEAQILFPSVSDPKKLATALVEAGAGIAVIKLGVDGAIALDRENYYEEPALPVSAIDTVGAGDSFVAAYLAEWLAKSAPQVRLQIAAYAAALTCETLGDWEGTPRRADLEMQRLDPVQR